jgi:hypothetical protein
VAFNGTRTFVGAESADFYMGVVDDVALIPSPIMIEIDAFDPETGAVTATVTMVSETASLANHSLRVVLFEDELGTTPNGHHHTHVTRDMFSTTFSLTGVGSTEVLNHTFTLEPHWKTDDLRVVAFVQAPDRSILQAGSFDEKPDFSVRGMVPFERTVIGPSGAMYETDQLTVMNTGLADTFTIELVVDDAPASWTFAFKDDGGTSHTDPLVFGLAADEQTAFSAVVNADEPGSARFHLEVSSGNLTRPLIISFTYISDDVDALIIDDDGAESFEDYFTTALDDAGSSYGIWDRASSRLNQDVADNFDVLIWNVGWSFPSLDLDDRDFLADFLDDGKSVFMSGQDVGWELNTSSSGNYDPVWYRTYLHTQYVRDDTNIVDLLGVAGDPITDGLDLHIAGPGGANNQTYPDEISPYDGDATLMLNYVGDGGAAVRSIDSVSGARVVNLGFGFEGINDAQDRQDLLGGSLDWLRGLIFEDGFESGDTTAWDSVTP